MLKENLYTIKYLMKPLGLRYQKKYEVPKVLHVVV